MARPSAALSERRSQALTDQELARNFAPQSGPQSWIDAWNFARAPRGASAAASSIRVGRDGAPDLALLLRAVQAQADASPDASGSATGSQPPPMRIELMRDGDALGTLELYADHWRFVSRFARTPGPRSGPLNPVLRDSINGELHRLGLLPP
jgi:hypothetical protein